MINEIGRYLQSPESYLSRTWQDFQENPIDSKLRQVAKAVFAVIYFISFPFAWSISMFGKCISHGNDIVPIEFNFDSDPMPIASPMLEFNFDSDPDPDPMPTTPPMLEFNFDPDALKIIPRPIPVPENTDSDLSYLKKESLRRAKNSLEKKRLNHIFTLAGKNDSFARENACVYFKAIEKKIRDGELKEDDINIFFMELIAGSDKCEPTWYLAGKTAYEKAGNQSSREDLLKLVQEYKEKLFIDPTLLPEGLKNADWNVIDCARYIFGRDYGLENRPLDVDYMEETGEDTRRSPLDIMYSDQKPFEKRIRQKLQDIESLIEWIKNNINLREPHLYYDFINELVKKYDLPIGAQQFYDEENNFLLRTKGVILMLLDIGILRLRNYSKV